MRFWRCNTTKFIHSYATKSYKFLLRLSLSWTLCTSFLLAVFICEWALYDARLSQNFSQFALQLCNKFLVHDHHHGSPFCAFSTSLSRLIVTTSHRSCTASWKNRSTTIWWTNIYFANYSFFTCAESFRNLSSLNSRSRRDSICPHSFPSQGPYISRPLASR